MKELSSLEAGSKKKTSKKVSTKPALKTENKRDLRAFYAFFFTLGLYVIVTLLCNKYPLGEYTILQSDLKSQYAPFLALMRNKFAELGSVNKDHLISYLTYSFQLGLGKNIMGTLGYYLASPFNLLYLLIDKAQIDAAVLLIVVLKSSLSSGFMCLFLGSRDPNKKSYWPVLLGLAYAFSLYSQAYLFQMMWLDGVMLLPLILFFTEKFIKEQKYAGLVISLLMLFVSNYYIAYMVGIASFLYLCIRMVVEKIDVKEALGIAARYVAAAAFTGLCTAVLLVPVGLDTIRNADQTISTRGDNAITYNPLTLVHMFLIGESGEFSDVLSGGYPFLFICLPVTLLMLVYFISPVFKGRERRAHAFCMLGVLISTAIYFVDKAWQVFDDPNWFWHRHVFVFLPLFLVITYRVLLRLKEIARKDIVKVMLIVLAMIVIDYSFGEIKGQSKIALYNIAFTLTYCGFFAGFGVTNWPDQLRDAPKLLSPLMSGIIVFELVFIGPMLSSNIETMTLFGGMAEEYSDSIRAQMQFGDYAALRNGKNMTGGFRAECERIPNYSEKYYADEGEPFYGNYYGMSFFNSNSNKKLHHFIKQLGIPTNYNYFAVSHNSACPSVDTFFSISTIASRREISFFKDSGITDSYGSGLMFYENDEVLPLGFAADKGAMDFDFYRLERDAGEKDYFALQNDWYRSLFPENYKEDFFVPIDESVTGEPVITNGVFFNSSDYKTYSAFLSKDDEEDNKPSKIEDPLGGEGSVKKQLIENMTYIYRSNSKIPIAVEYNFKAPTTDEIYCSLVTGRIVDGMKVYVNGIQIDGCNSNAYYSQMFRIGSFEEGEDVKVTFLSDENMFSYLNIRFASFDDSKFESQFVDVDRWKVAASEVCDGYARFDIKDLEPNELVITTIPAEDGWQLYIDGNPCEYTAYQDAFIAFDPGQGSHTAELVFTAPGLKAGALASCVGVVGLAAFIFIDKKRSKMKENKKA